MEGFGMGLCELGDPGPMRERLVWAVLAGYKTATSSLLSDWEHENAELPQVGERQMIVDSEARPVSVIEFVRVDVIRLDDVDLPVALAEGEGFRSVREWRDEHERFWSARGTGAAISLDDDARVVVEGFRLVARVRE
jgi:uncharacterized protein YhfF